MICYQELLSSARMDYVTSGWAKAGTFIWRCAKLLAHLRDSMNFLTVVWSFLSTTHSFYLSPSIPVLLSTGFQSLDPILCVPSHFCVRVLPEFLASLASTKIPINLMAYFLLPEAYSVSGGWEGGARGEGKSLEPKSLLCLWGVLGFKRFGYLWD